MKALLKIILDQPFILATGLAALIHSTWSLGTLFAGMEPSAEQDFWIWFRWVFPAFLIAFSLDVGQIVVSADLRSGNRNRAMYATFAALALATYYLQWSYMAAHIPLVELAPGVRPDNLPFAKGLRDAAVWIVPGLLPLSTTLYTFSYEKRPTFPRRPSAPPNVTVTERNSERKIELRTTGDLEQPGTQALLQSAGTPDAPLALSGTQLVEAWFADHPEALEQLARKETSYRKVADQIGVSHSTVMRVVRTLE